MDAVDLGGLNAQETELHAVHVFSEPTRAKARSLRRLRRPPGGFRLVQNASTLGIALMEFEGTRTKAGGTCGLNKADLNRLSVEQTRVKTMGVLKDSTESYRTRTEFC